MTGRNGGANPGRGKMRLFVALDLPESVRDEVEAWRREALTDPALRHTGLRIVLLFLGHRPAREVALLPGSDSGAVCSYPRNEKIGIVGAVLTGLSLAAAVVIALASAA